jgi:predicted transcriptional regulator
MKRTVDLSEEFNARLKAMAEHKGVSISAIIKMACKEFLDREESGKAAPMPPKGR